MSRGIQIRSLTNWHWSDSITQFNEVTMDLVSNRKYHRLSVNGSCSAEIFHWIEFSTISSRHFRIQIIRSMEDSWFDCRRVDTTSSSRTALSELRKTEALQVIFQYGKVYYFRFPLEANANKLKIIQTTESLSNWFLDPVVSTCLQLEETKSA